MALSPASPHTLEALAEALFPGSDGLPAAADLDLLPAIERQLAAQPRRSRTAIAAGLKAFELSSLPRGRFSRLSTEARRRHVERGERSRLRVRRDLTLMAKALVAFAYGRAPAVLASLGVVSTCRIGSGTDDPAWDPPAPPLDREALVPAEGVERADVVIVGSGAGGAAAARVLAEGGLDVLVLEAGPYLNRDDYPSDPLAAIERLYRDGAVTVCEGRPVIPIPIGRCVGGTTVVNSGTCFRAPDDVLLGWRDEHGVSWATDLDEEFEQVERALAVRAVDRERIGANASACARGAEALGLSHGPIRRNAGDVDRCSACPTGCPLDAKRAAHVSELPRAVAAGTRIRAGVEVSEIVVEAGCATGVRARLAAGGLYEARGKAVVLAAGTFGTAELLLSHGLANSSGQVGRNLRIHPVTGVAARFEDPIRGWDDVMQSWYVDEWHDRGITLEATFTPLPFALPLMRGAGERLTEEIAGFGHTAILGVQCEDRESVGRLRSRGRRSRASYRLRPAQAEALRFGMARAAEILAAAGATAIHPHAGRMDALDPRSAGREIEAARLRAADLRVEAFHPMGTVRMGVDPRESVIGPTGEAHDVAGLYVADASVFPTATRLNPMITIMAVARRIAAQVGERIS